MQIVGLERWRACAHGPNSQLSSGPDPDVPGMPSPVGDVIVCNVYVVRAYERYNTRAAADTEE